MKQRNAALKPAALWRQMKGHRFILAEHDGDLWFTNTYLLARVTGDRLDALADMMGLYNLTPEPMVCEANQTLMRLSVETPDVCALLAKVPPGVAATRETIGSSGLLVESQKGPLQVWALADRTRVYVNPNMVALVDLLSPGGEWFGSDALKPLVKREGERPLGLLMPVRHEPLFNQARDAA